MAVVLIARPYGLLGRPQGAVRSPAEIEDPIRPASVAAQAARQPRRWSGCSSLPLAAKLSPYTLVLGIDVLIAILFATSLHFIMGPGGMHSFGHAAYFGLGAYGAGADGQIPGGADGGSRCSAAPLPRWRARCCSAGSRCGCPASISRC